jgi:hypothetical protein
MYIKKRLSNCISILFYRVNSVLPARFYPFSLKLLYSIKWKFQKKLDLKNPKTFNEKIQWLKLYDSTPIKSLLADKYNVREWIKEKIGNQYLVPLLGVWDRFDDINFNVLPNRFVLKATHGSAMNIIVKDKAHLNMAYVIKEIRQWQKTNIAFWSLELCYKDIKPQIIAEEFLENQDEELYDYKVWCFNGKPHYIAFMTERYNKLKMAFYDLKWKRMPFVSGPLHYEQEIPKPDNLDELLKIAGILCQDFSHVRVDFYRLNDGSLKFGEMTFYPSGGFCRWKPPEWDAKLGALIELPTNQK